MAYPFGQDKVAQILEGKNFTVLEVFTDPEDDKNTGFIITHDSKPDKEIIIRLTSKLVDGEDVSTMNFEGEDDDFTEEEAKIILNEVMEAFIEVIEVSSDDPEEQEEASEGGE